MERENKEKRFKNEQILKTEFQNRNSKK